MRYPAVLFDLDGTLLDSIELILASYRHTFAAFGRSALPEEHWRRGIGRPLEATFGEVADSLAERDAMILAYREHNIAHHEAMAAPYPGARDAVLALRDAGVRLGLVTSKRRIGAERGLRLLRLDGTFHVVIGADDTERHKPDPEPVLLAMSRLGCDAPEVLFVGDSTHDLNAGRRAGVATAAATWGPFPLPELTACEPTHSFASFPELLAMLLPAR